MAIFKKGLLVYLLSAAAPVVAADIPDYATFYTQYRANVTPQNNLTVTADITATGNIYLPGSDVTVIDGGGFGFDGNSHVGFLVDSGQTVSFINGGSFSVSDLNLTVSKAYTGFQGIVNGGAFQNEGGILQLTDMTVTDNIASRRGGAVNQEAGSSLILENSAFRNNRANRDSGGALSNDYEATAVITNSFFDANTAYRDGGALFNDGTLTVENSVFTANTAGSGGAVYNSNVATLTDVVFDGNSGSTDIGAVYNSGQMTITRGTFTNNNGWDGGAVGNIGMLGDDMYLSVTDSVFDGNSAVLEGGAVYNDDVAYLIDSTFTNNSAAEGGAVFNMGILNMIALDKDVVFENNTAGGVSNAVHTIETLHLNAGDHSIIFNDRITGSGEIIVNPDYQIQNANVPTTGTIVLNEDMTGYTGSVDIRNGTVQVTTNGRFFKASDLIVEKGTLDIGLSQAVVGNAIFQSGSRLALFIQNQTTYGSLVADTVSVETGATLQATLSPEAMESQTQIRLPLIQSAQTFDDLFSPVIDNNLYTFTALGNGWYEISQTETYADVVAKAGGSQNNQNTAQAWETDPASAGPSYEMYLELDALAQNDGSAFVQALTALAPTTAPLMQVLSQSFLNQFDAAVETDRSEYQIGDGVLWAAGTTQMSRLKKTASYAPVHIYGNGISAGIEYTKADWTIGGAYLYRYDRMKNIYRRIRVPTHGAGIYAVYQPNSFIWKTKLSYFYSHFKEYKNVAGYSVSNKLSLETIGAQTDFGYRINAGSWQIVPKIGAQYAMIRHKTAQDAVGQILQGKKLQFLTPYAEITVERQWALSADFFVRPSVSVGTSYDLSSSKDNAWVRLSDGITYTVAAERLPRWQQDVSVGIAAGLGDRFELRLDAQAGFRSHYENYAGSLKAIYQF